MGNQVIKVNITLLLIVGMVACSKREDRPAPSPSQQLPTQQPPGAPGSQGPQKDLVQQDTQRRQSDRGALVTSNPGISTTPLIKKPRLDDVVVTSLQVKTEKNSVVNSKFVVVLKTSADQAVAYNFSGEKKMSAQGDYIKLVSLDKNQKQLSVESRCLATCEHVLVRARRGSGEESAFVFKIADTKSGVGQLTMLPGLEQDANAARLLDMSRIVEVSYPAAQALEGVQKMIDSSRTQVEKVASENEEQGADAAAVTELRRGIQMLQSVQSESDAALTELYSLAGVSLKSGGVKLSLNPEQLSSIDRKLLSASQNIAIVAGIVTSHVTNGKIRKLVDDNSQVSLVDELRGIQELLNTTREKLPLITQLVGKIGA